MKLYQLIDGTMVGFYREEGAQVKAVLYRDVYEQQLVTKKREEEVVVAGYYEQYDIITPGYWEEKEVFVQGHYERQMVWHPEYSVKRYREVPGHYETQNIWVPEYSVTRHYLREAHPARGLEAAWIPYEEVIPAGYKDQRVWVDNYTEEYEETMPAGEKETRVWVEGDYEMGKKWIPEKTRTETVWVEPKFEMQTVEYKEPEEVWVGQEPVYEFVDPYQENMFEIVDLIEAAVGQIAVEDKVVIRNLLTGEELTTTARYLGMAERIDDNEFVVH